MILQIIIKNIYIKYFYNFVFIINFIITIIIVNFINKVYKMKENLNEKKKKKKKKKFYLLFIK